MCHPKTTPTTTDASLRNCGTFALPSSVHRVSWPPARQNFFAYFFIVVFSALDVLHAVIILSENWKSLFVALEGKIFRECSQEESHPARWSRLDAGYVFPAREKKNIKENILLLPELNVRERFQVERFSEENVAHFVCNFTLCNFCSKMSTNWLEISLCLDAICPN